MLPVLAHVEASPIRSIYAQVRVKGLTCLLYNIENRTHLARHRPLSHALSHPRAWLMARWLDVTAVVQARMQAGEKA